MKFQKLSLFLIIAMSPFSLWSQTSLDNPSLNESQPKKYTYQPHTIGISTRWGGAGIFNAHKNGYIGLSTTTIDFYAGKRVGKTKYTSLIQFRLSIPFLPYSSPFPFLNEFRWGILFGGSQYVFDHRSSQGTGWSMLVNGGLLFDMPTIERMTGSPEQSVLNLGTELDFKTIYNFKKHTAITFGFNIGYTMSYTFRQHVTLGGSDGFPQLIPVGIYLEHAFVWGLNIGILF